MHGLFEHWLTRFDQYKMFFFINFVLEYFARKKLHVWQIFPVKFELHAQVYLVILTTVQFPPFIQGLFEHGFIT